MQFGARAVMAMAGYSPLSDTNDETFVETGPAPSPRAIRELSVQSPSRHVLRRLDPHRPPTSSMSAQNSRRRYSPWQSPHFNAIPKAWHAAPAIRETSPEIPPAASRPAIRAVDSPSLLAAETPPPS